MRRLTAPNELPLLGLSKDRPSTVRPSRSPLPDAHRCRSSAHVLRDEHADAHPRSALVFSRHLGGFLLRDGACVLQHAASHGVRHVSARTGLRRPLGRLDLARASPQRAPALRSHPHTAANDRCRSPAGRRHRNTQSPVDRVHRLPCPFVVSVAAWSDGSLHHRRPVRSRARIFAAPAPAPSRRLAARTYDGKLPSPRVPWVDLEALLHARARHMRDVSAVQAPELPWAWMTLPPA